MTGETEHETSTDAGACSTVEARSVDLNSLSSCTEVSVWFWSLHAPAHEVSRLASLLSADERQRAARFNDPSHASRFIVGRGRMREILGDRYNQAARLIAFDYGPQGKPTFRDASLRSFFNLSHSGTSAMLGVSERDLGVDIEHIRPLVPDLEQVFSPVERLALARLSPAAQPSGFYNCWTRKEAFVKALGGGLTIALDEFDVTLAPSEPSRLLRLPARYGLAEDWTLISIAPAEKCVAAVAVASRNCRVLVRERLQRPARSVSGETVTPEGVRVLGGQRAPAARASINATEANADEMHPDARSFDDDIGVKQRTTSTGNMM